MTVICSWIYFQANIYNSQSIIMNINVLLPKNTKIVSLWTGICNGLLIVFVHADTHKSNSFHSRGIDCFCFWFLLCSTGWHMSWRYHECIWRHTGKQIELCMALFKNEENLPICLCYSRLLPNHCNYVTLYFLHIKQHCECIKVSRWQRRCYSNIVIELLWVMEATPHHRCHLQTH